MLVIFMTRIKHKLLKGLRFALVFTIIAILIVQLAGLIKATGFYPEEKVPSGNAIKVDMPIEKACDDELEHGVLDRFIEKLLNKEK